MNDTHIEANKTIGSGQHSHEIPTVAMNVVLMRDGAHNGTHVYLTSDGDYMFVSLDYLGAVRAERCVFVLGQDPDTRGHTLHACDLDTPRGLFLIGVDKTDDLSWVTAGAKVLWDSLDEVK